MSRMIEAKMLCLRKGRDDPKNSEGVLPVFNRRLYDRGVVFRAGFRAEASAGLEFGLGRPQGLLAVVVRGWDDGLMRKVKMWSLCLVMPFLSLSKPALFRVYRRRVSSFSSRAYIFFRGPTPTFP